MIALWKKSQDIAWNVAINLELSYFETKVCVLLLTPIILFAEYRLIREEKFQLKKAWQDTLERYQ